MTWYRIGAFVLIAVLSGCMSTDTRSDGHRTLIRTETPTADGGKITKEYESTEEKAETVTKADISAAVQSGLAALRGDIPTLMKSVCPSAETIAAAVPKPTEPTLLGLTMPQIVGAAGTLWAAERGVAVYHKRRRRIHESLETK